MILVVNLNLLKLNQKSRRYLAAVFFICLNAFLLFVLQACSDQTELLSFNIQGNTMGTYYSVTLIPNDQSAWAKKNKTEIAHNVSSLQQQIDMRLLALNASLSTYQSNSLISRFNQLTSPACITLDYYMLDVFSVSQQVYRASNQLFNPAVAALVELWGFGLSPIKSMPSQEQVDLAKRHSDFAGLDLQTVNQQKQLCKQDNITLNFSAVAKGYAVDVITALLGQAGFTHMLVDIGGELRAVGVNSQGKPWRVAIEKPDETIMQSVYQVVSLSDHSVATSGNYRNFFELDGQRFAHTIDPRTGYPVKHELLSATVVHSKAVFADAWATALMAAGIKEAMALASENQLAVYLITQQQPSSELMIHGHWIKGEMDYWAWHSPQFADYLP